MKCEVWIIWNKTILDNVWETSRREYYKYRNGKYLSSRLNGRLSVLVVYGLTVQAEVDTRNLRYHDCQTKRHGKWSNFISFYKNDNQNKTHKTLS
jgi:hypothetical protein